MSAMPPEAMTVLAVICAAWTVTPVADHPIVARYGVTLRPANGVPMRLTRR